jgi:apolipoprotein N-acyltransferase
LKVNYRKYIPAFISGAALAFCFPVFDLSYIAWFALAPFLVSLWDKSPREAFKAGIVMGVPYFFGTQYWVYHSIANYGGMPLPASFSLVFLLALYESLFLGVFGLLFSRKIRETSLPAMFLAPVFWTVLEFLRSYALTGFPWSSLGYSQYRSLSLIQFADITGVYGVSFLVVMVNGSLSDLFIARKRRARMPLFHLAPTLSGYVLLFLALAAVVLYGNHRLGEEIPGSEVTVSVVQGNIEQDMKWDPAYQKSVTEIYKALTLDSLGNDPSLVVWPETAVPFYFEHDKELTGEMIDFQKSLGTRLLFGAITVKGPGKLSNSALLLNEDGALEHVYDKIHLVPFGEYVPLRKLLFFVNRLAVGIGDYLPGNSLERFKTPFGEFGTLICYEVIFPGLARKFFKDGGDFLVTITNDAWFGRTAGPYQHFSMAVFRAVENRKPVVRAANTGVSGFIDSNGKILSSTRLFERTVLEEKIITDRRRTFYSRYGDLFSYFCIVMTLVMFLYMRRSNDKGRN